MRMVAHLSDLHFGMEDERIAESLLEDIAGFHPSVVVISMLRKKEFLIPSVDSNRDLDYR